MKTPHASSDNVRKLCGAIVLLWALLIGSAPAQQTPPTAPALTPASASAGSQPKARQDTSQIKLGATCITSDCHADLKKAKFTHGPVNLNQCQPCHEPVDNKHVFAKGKEGPAQCFICHEQAAPKKVVHSPFAADCTACHDPHGSNARHFIKANGAELCLKCHGKVTAGMSVIHGPVGMGQCVVCHTPHQSDFKHLLVEAPEKICLDCHVDVQQSMQGAVSVHKPAMQDCSGCHNAHGGNNKNMLVAEGKALCQKCHGDFLKQVNQFKFPHQPMAEGKACQNCHKPHSSNQARLLKGENMELCLSCHNKPIEAGKRTIANVEAQIKDSKFLHGPIRQHNCIACHEAHGSDFANILDKAFPADFYAPYQEHTYDLCFNCHDRQIVLSEKSKATGFRNGERNLHFLHVNRDKGRSCRACHDEHASNQPKHIRAEVAFGRWTFQTEYTQTPTGGGCTTGCHLPYKYDREKPIDNKPVAMK